jgi:hypothetical protein
MAFGAWRLFEHLDCDEFLKGLLALGLEIGNAADLRITARRPTAWALLKHSRAVDWR